MRRRVFTPYSKHCYTLIIHPLCTEIWYLVRPVNVPHRYLVGFLYKMAE